MNPTVKILRVAQKSIESAISAREHGRWHTFFAKIETAKAILETISPDEQERNEEIIPDDFLPLPAPAISGNLVDTLRGILSPPERKGV